MNNKTREIIDYVRRYRARGTERTKVLSGLHSQFRYQSLLDAASTLTGVAVARDEHPAEIIMQQMYGEWGDYHARKDEVMEAL